MITADNITDEQLEMLKKYIIQNAYFLVCDNKISLDDYYLNDNSKKWIIVNIQELGELRIYRTDCATILKINGHEVLPKERCRDLDFFSIISVLKIALIEKDEYKKMKWFEMSL